MFMAYRRPAGNSGYPPNVGLAATSRSYGCFVQRNSDMRHLLCGTLATAALGTVLMAASAIPAAAQIARPQSALGMSGGSDLILVQNRDRGGGGGGGGDRGGARSGGGGDRSAGMARSGGNDRSIRMERGGGNDRSVRMERSGGNDRSVRMERGGGNDRNIRVERSVRGERSVRTERSARIEDLRHSRWSRERWSNRDRSRWSNNWRWRHRHHHNGGFGIGFASGYYAPYAYQPYPYVGDDAVAYCMSRYQSYDIASGTYLGYDGLRHPCP